MDTPERRAHGAHGLLGALLWAGVPRLPGVAKTPELGQRCEHPEGPCCGAPEEDLRERLSPRRRWPWGSPVAGRRARGPLLGWASQGPLLKRGLSAASILPPVGPPGPLPVSQHCGQPRATGRAWGTVVLVDTCGQCGSEPLGVYVGSAGAETYPGQLRTLGAVLAGDSGDMEEGGDSRDP